MPLAQAAAGGAMAAHALARDLLLAGGLVMPPAVREARGAAALARWPDLIGRMAIVEGLAPNAANAGWLQAAELADIAEAALQGRDPPPPRPAEAAAFALDLADALVFASDPTAHRGHVRFALEDAFAAWSRLCRRMSAITAPTLSDNRTS